MSASTISFRPCSCNPSQYMKCECSDTCQVCRPGECKCKTPTVCSCIASRRTFFEDMDSVEGQQALAKHFGVPARIHSGGTIYRQFETQADADQWIRVMNARRYDIFMIGRGSWCYSIHYEAQLPFIDPSFCYFMAKMRTKMIVTIAPRVFVNE